MQGHHGEAPGLRALPPALRFGANDSPRFRSGESDNSKDRQEPSEGIALGGATSRRETIASPRGTTTIAYDPATGHVESITTPEGNALVYEMDGPLVETTTWTGEVSGSVERTYDENFRVETISVNGANPVAYVYDDDGLVTQAGDLALVRDPVTGLLTDTTLGVVTTHYDYSDFGELEAMSAAISGSPVYETSYIRDDLGRITTKTEMIEGVTTTYVYGYDPAGRLDTVTIDGVLAADYDYDDNGNRLAKTAPSGTETGVYDDQDRMTSYGGASFTYTRNGELLTKTDPSGTTTYDYDVFGNLFGLDLPDGAAIDYVVDARNRRIGKKINGVLVQGFLWQGQLSPIAELDGVGNLVSRFVYARRVNVPDYMIRGASAYRILTDHLGSPRLVVNAATGAIAQRIDYDEWGNVLLDSNPGWEPFGFAGGLFDSDSMLLRLGARSLQLDEGRFASKDVSRFRGGTANLYEYAFNDPVNIVDRDGRAITAVAPAVVLIGTAIVITAILTTPQGQELVQDTAQAIEDWWRKVPPLLPMEPGVHDPAEPIEYRWPKAYPAAPGRRGPAPGPVCPADTPARPFPDIAPWDDPGQPPDPERVWDESLDKRMKKLLDDLAGGLGDFDPDAPGPSE